MLLCHCCPLGGGLRSRICAWLGEVVLIHMLNASRVPGLERGHVLGLLRVALNLGVFMLDEPERTLG